MNNINSLTDNNNNNSCDNEVFGNFISASINPTLHSSYTNNTTTPTLNEIINSNEKYIIDNNILYKKLINLENEIQVLKSMIASIQYPHPIIYPTQYNLPQTGIKHTIFNPYSPITNNTKPNKGHFF